MTGLPLLSKPVDHHLDLQRSVESMGLGAHVVGVRCYANPSTAASYPAALLHSTMTDLTWTTGRQ